MTFKFVLIAALVACVRAGGPASYSISAPSISYGHVGSSHENTVKGLYGQNVLSQYSKAVDSAHSSVRVASSRYSNDGLHYGAAYAAPAYAAHAIAAPAYASHAIAAPIRAYSAPAYGHAYAAPAYGHAYAAHGLAAHGYAAPAISAHGFAANAYAPAIAHAPLGYGHAALGYKAPIAAAYAAPYAYKTPVAAVHAGGPIVHTSFAGLGASYAW